MSTLAKSKSHLSKKPMANNAERSTTRINIGYSLSNIIMNDIIYELQGVCSLHDYADDNAIRCSHSDMNILKIKLEKALICR